MTADGDWGEIIDKEEAERFVGREQELETFRQQISRTPPRYLIFYITGQGGVGKTTLLNRYQEIAKDFRFLLANCDELQRDIPAVLGRFAHQLTEQGYSLKRFNERYKTYRQKIDEIESDPEAPQGLAALVGRTVVRATFIAGDMVPGLRKGLDYLPRETIETQASEWATYLAKKLGNKDEVALVREPTPILTPLFFEDLNEIAKQHRVLLCFENFEETRLELQDWFLRLREYKPSQDIRIAIAGRDRPGTKWDPLRSVTMIVHLDVFTEQEAEEFLNTYKITDSRRRTEILEFSDRLPVLMNWLAAPESQEPDPSVPTYDIVERFLRWVTEPTRRQVALLAALPRSFNVDILKLLLEYREQTVDEQSSFAWLLTMPFVKQHADGWRYHDVVRRKMLHYQHQERPQTFRKTHMALADFYNKRRDELGLTEGETWTNEQWRVDTLAYAYHLLVADPIKHWGEILSLFVVAVRIRRTLAIEMIELLSLGDVRDELSREQNEIVQLLRQQLQAVESGDLKDGLEMFDRLCGITDLSSQAKGYVHAYRGECHRQHEKWEKALNDFKEALHYISGDAWAIARRGETYRDMERYQEALADFDRAIALDEKYAWAIAGRGQTYRLMGSYQEALADFDRAIALDEKDAWVIASRGETYRDMERYQEALADFDQAIALDEKYAWAIASRGETYRLMERYQEALADFDQAIALDEKYAWAIASRGLTHQQMEHYREALIDFNRAVTLDAKNASIIAHRGQTYRLMGSYQEALADFDRAIAPDEKDAWVIASRGLTHQQMERYQEALADFDRAIAIDEKYDWAIARRGEIYRLMERYQEALADFDRAITLNDKNDWAIAHRGETYQAMERYQEALADFDRAIALDDKNDWAIASRGETYQTMERYQEALADFDRAIALNDKNDWAIASRGETYQAMERYQEALADYDRAIALDDKDDWAIASRGETYQTMERYQEALADFDRAIALNDKNDWAIASRGEIYRLMERYQEALADYDRAIALDEKYSLAIAHRGEIYRLMERYQEALADFDRAIALDEKYSLAIAHRGEIYRLMERYQEALADFDRAIALDEKYSWAITLRGQTYRLMKRYEEALADYDRAIALNDKDDWAIASRGQIYRLMKRYEEALADYDRAIALNDKDDWAIAQRGQTYRLMKRYEEALADYDRAIALNDKNDWYRYSRAQLYILIGQIKTFESDIQNAIELGQAELSRTPDDCRLGFNLALYYLAARNVTETESLYTRFASACLSLAYLQDAVDDLTDFLSIQPSNELAQRMCTHLQTRIVELHQPS